MGVPASTGSGEPTFCRSRVTKAKTSVVSSAALFVGSSPRVVVVITAVLVSVVVPAGKTGSSWTTISAMPKSPPSMSPTSTVTTLPEALHVPAVVVQFTNVVRAGNVSVMTTF